MTLSHQKDASIEEFETRYQMITALYDYAEELVSTVESELVSDAEAQLAVVEPLINDIGDATDILAEEFLLVAESKRSKSQGKASKTQIEAAMRKIFTALADYHARVRDVTKKAHGAIMNIADPVVQKIQRHMEQVVVVFLEYVQISLQSIMNKAELDALKARDARVALMMHQHAMGQQS